MRGAGTEADLLDQLAEFDLIELSTLQVHEGTCCLDSRTHLLGPLYAQSDVGAALARIPALVKWAPTRWPAFWCDVRAEDDSGFAGDCGTHAYIASQVLNYFGIPHGRGRIAIRVSNHLLDHWRTTWEDSRGDVRWIGDGVVHHEVLRIGDRWWDPSEACWFAGPGDWLDCGLVVAVREQHGEWDLVASQRIATE